MKILIGITSKSLYLAFFFFFYIQSVSTQIYVSVGSTGNGSSWTNALGDLQIAIDMASINEVILIAEGIYYPSSSPYGDIDNSRNKSFHIASNLILKGGYDPLTGTQTGDSTILSGDLLTAFGISDSVYHVMITTGLDSTSIFDNLTFRDGKANGNISTNYQGMSFNHNYGGGLYNRNSSPTISNCNFIKNIAALNGGGIYNSLSSPILINSTFIENSAYSGGGIYNKFSTPFLTNCSFVENSVILDGGGINNVFSDSIVLTNCTFTRNSSDISGGGIANKVASSTLLINCTFTKNSAHQGGGISNSYSISLIDCIFTENSATIGGGIQTSSSTLSSNISAAPSFLDNCTFIGNTADNGGGIYSNFHSTVTVANCTFFNNYAIYSGGGMYSTSYGTSTFYLTNSTFKANTSLADDSSITIINGSNLKLNGTINIEK